MPSLKYTLLGTLGIILSACITSCTPYGSQATSLKDRTMTSQNISWANVIHAPRHYPVELVAGENFWIYDNGRRHGFTGHAGGGWRTAGADAGGGSGLPDAVNLTWLSDTEDKYYHVRAKIPKEKILAEFQRKLSMDTADELHSERFKEIIFALSPGGFVSMRLGWAERKEIAQFQAQEVQIPWEYFAKANHFNPEGLTEERYFALAKEDLPDRIKEQIKNGTIPTERWKMFNTQKFPWYVDSSLDLYGYTEFLINGEDKFHTKADLAQQGYMGDKAAPIWYRVFYKKGDQRYRATLVFSQNDPDALEQPEGDIEIFELFQSYFADSPKPAALVIDVIDGKVVAYLDNGSKKQALPLYDAYYEPLKDHEYPWFK